MHITRFPRVVPNPHSNYYNVKEKQKKKKPNKQEMIHSFGWKVPRLIHLKLPAGISSQDSLVFCNTADTK